MVCAPGGLLFTLYVPLTALFVSVCSGIPPGAAFTYDVPFEKAGQWGTYWAHGHFTVRNHLRMGSGASVTWLRIGTSD